MIKYIHEQGLRAGIAIKPKTPVDVLYEILDSNVKEEVPDVRRPTFSSFDPMLTFSDGTGHDS